MRIANLSWGLCATMLIAGTVHAGEQFDALDDSPSFMLYVQKQVGAAHHKSRGPSFGFAVDRPIASASQIDQSALRAPSARIFDLRVAPFDHGAVMLNGYQLTGETRGLGFDSYGGNSWDNPWLWVALGLGAALGISCATDNWPCDNGGYNGNNNYQVPGT